MPPVSSPGLGTPSGHRSPRPGSRESALARVRFRRAITLLVMTLLLPGSAQLAAGRPDVGRIAIRVGLSVVGSFVLVVLLGLVWHGLIYWMASNTVVLGFIRLLLCGLAIGWALLFFDAWRLGILRIHAPRRFALGAAAEAHRALESRGTVGPLVLLP